MEITYRVKHNGCGRLYLSRRKEKKKKNKERKKIWQVSHIHPVVVSLELFNHQNVNFGWHNI
jgi:hypothetical protein